MAQNTPCHFPHFEDESSRGKARSVLDGFNGWKRKDETDAAIQCFSFALDKLFLEVPRQNQVIVGIHSSRFRFANDRNISAQRMCAILVGIALGRKINYSIVDVTPLQNCISFSGGSIDMNFLSLLFQPLKQRGEFLFMNINSILKIFVWHLRVQS